MRVILGYFDVLIFDALEVVDFTGWHGVDPTAFNPCMPDTPWVSCVTDVTLDGFVACAVLCHEEKILRLGKLFHLVKANVMKLFPLVVVFVRFVLAVAEGVLCAGVECPCRNLEGYILVAILRAK
jgi:hypothetical protein